MADLSRREADLALRFVRPTQRDLVIRRVGTVPSGSTRRRGTCEDRPRAAAGSPEDVVMLHESMDASPGVRVAPRSGSRARASACGCDSTLAVRAAVLAGAGAGVLPDYLATIRRCDSSRPAAVRRDVFLVYHRALRASARVRAAGRFVVDCFASRLAP